MNKKDFSGILELELDGSGFTRNFSREFQPTADDVFISKEMISRFRLREGCFLTGSAVSSRKRWEIVSIDEINGTSPPLYRHIKELTRQTAIAPETRIRIETQDVTTRILDLICPIGLGQRALIVAPPKSGKTVMLQKLAEAITKNHNDLEVLVLLVDERPEEITDIERSIKAKVFASSNDKDFASHARISRLTLEYAKRQAEVGKDIVILIDSLTRLGRAYNVGSKGSGRIMSGGIDARALEIPKKIFGASRNIEDGGSLTIVATILIDTGSRMDELIFQEFKGTGNAEIVLDRELADQRIYPAINIRLSGVRREELLFGSKYEACQRIRRALMTMKDSEALKKVRDLILKTESNDELFTMF